MIELGKYQILEAVKKTDFGFYLAETNSTTKQTILLPIKEAPEGTCVGDKIEVFIYKDSEDRIIATTAKVPVTIGELAVLPVKEVSKIGAFLDWGLLKDLFLPYKEQTAKVQEGDSVLVTLYVDKSDRLCASMKVYPLLSTQSPYKKDDIVEGIVYEDIESFGLFVAVDHKYSAMLPRNEVFNPIKVGDTIQARVIHVRDDGKLTLSTRQKSYLQMDADAETIMTKLKASGGFLPYQDNSDPEEIKNEFRMSKNAFKRAIGKLYKDGSIVIKEDGIRLK
ncbi:S1 RNA-binding domain-containing protein [Lachnospiraceae bacterium MD1]|jgi:predicted RNA-binding protein (virulence factor B family)|uniref:S1 RNA-binding domain-containing protein n=1 Tax=Variimorphobacter saccharofermentans TaxID=2755051 RepID=A0A839JVR2_9FIRM|nr:S1-like domain-containing RNA-binding protein [Variimorphobacter saccharofermentans]MBB2181560.1 S1 RNA-binding domain-containing protein [Variimorphobacter saccharofermentans]